MITGIEHTAIASLTLTGWPLVCGASGLRDQLPVGAQQDGLYQGGGWFDDRDHRSGSRYAAGRRHEGCRSATPGTNGCRFQRGRGHVAAEGRPLSDRMRRPWTAIPRCFSPTPTATFCTFCTGKHLFPDLPDRPRLGHKRAAKCRILATLKPSQVLPHQIVDVNVSRVGVIGVPDAGDTLCDLKPPSNGRWKPPE